MKFRKSKRKSLCIIVALAMLITAIPGMSLTAFAEEDATNTQTYGNYTFTKISNPTTGTREADGINTNDTTGYAANRLNSYAWAVDTRGDSIYVGTNRTLFGSALNAVASNFQSDVLTPEKLGQAVTILTGGDVPVNLAEEDYIPQIIKFDVENGSTKVIYQPTTARGEDGILYYTDKDGAIIPDAAVTSETASYRSVVQFRNNLYFGSLGTHMLQLVRVNEQDEADVVFQTIGLISSLRAGCVYDDGDGETVYFGGQDTTYPAWRQYRATHPEDPKMLPIVIRYLDPETAGTDHEDWSGLVADFTDFGEYSRASVYATGGGNVWDLCSYNGKLYLVLAYDGGWALFRGEKGGSNPNKFGWTWTEIVGNNGNYPLAMNEEVAVLNQQYADEYGCAGYRPNLNGTGLLESTATPYVYNGKMYLGSFDNATTIQSQTVVKALVKFQKITDPESWKKGDFGPTLTQIFAPIYEVLSHPQHIYVMDENETITAVDSANALLDGTTNDYVWRFIENDGKLYTGTFDSSTAFIYFLDYSKDRIVSLLEQNKDTLPDYLQMLLDGNFSDALKDLLFGTPAANPEEAELQQSVQNAAMNASLSAEAFLDGDATVEQLLEDMTNLDAARKELENHQEAAPAPAEEKINQDASDNASEDGLTAAEGTSNEAANSINAEIPEFVMDLIPEKAKGMIDWLSNLIDLEGLQYWADARELAVNAEQGFDIFVTEDGENWDKIVGDGLKDTYNYGARTFTIYNDEVYVGTANPYYGAQLWKLTETAPGPIIPYTGWLCEDGQWYYIMADRMLTSSWVCDDGFWYYLGADGVMVTGWSKIDGVWYFLKGNGQMAENEWIDGWWLDAGSGAWTYKAHATWKQDAKGWWYGDNAGWYAKDETVMIDYISYSFDAAGYWIP